MIPQLKHVPTRWITWQSASNNREALHWQVILSLSRLARASLNIDSRRAVPPNANRLYLRPVYLLCSKRPSHRNDFARFAK